MALGRSRLLEALDPLRACWQEAHSPELKQNVLLAIAILRQTRATDYLTELIASESETDAIAALSALEIYKDDVRIRERIAKLVDERGSQRLRACFDRDFRLVER